LRIIDPLWQGFLKSQYGYAHALEPLVIKKEAWPLTVPSLFEN
jgi:hypothetical protein